MTTETDSTLAEISARLESLKTLNPLQKAFAAEKLLFIYNRALVGMAARIDELEEMKDG